MKKKILLILLPILHTIFFIGIILIAIIGIVAGKQFAENKTPTVNVNSYVLNNQIYASRYRELLNKYLINNGYVTLERLVFYLQRKYNVLDTSTLSMKEWEDAYLINLDKEEKQMIPIKTICKNIENNLEFPTFNVLSGINSNGIEIDVIDLCNVNGEKVVDSNEYDEFIYPLPFSFPLKTDFLVTSIVFENRNINFGLSEEEQAQVNFHSGWDFSVPIGTEFYSICDGKISKITNTQNNDLPFKDSGNQIGNYVKVKCDNDLTVDYYHIKYRSVPSYLSEGSIVKKKDLLGITSTTGRSSGPHLHLGLENSEGQLLDALQFIDFNDRN